MPICIEMPEGQMFYSVTYGKGQMGRLCFATEHQAALDGHQLYKDQAGYKTECERRCGSGISRFNNG